MDPAADARQHLEAAIAAYGSDLVLPAGRTLPRAAAPASPPVEHAPPTTPPATTPASAAPSPTRPPQPGPATTPVAATPPDAPAPQAAAAALLALRQEVMPCTRCKLCEGRQNVVFGEGNPRARAMFVGEAPGAVEDQTGRPFVGPAGKLLDRIIEGAMGLRRQDVYIANVNKCRPPDNRAPEPDEVAACLPYLRRQVAAIRPEVIVALGGTAAHNLLGNTESVGRLRGRTLRYEGIPVVVTWHPAFLLRDPSHKPETWEDIKRVNRMLGLPEVPGRSQPKNGAPAGLPTDAATDPPAAGDAENSGRPSA